MYSTYIYLNVYSSTACWQILELDRYRPENHNYFVISGYKIFWEMHRLHLAVIVVFTDFLLVVYG